MSHPVGKRGSKGGPVVGRHRAGGNNPTAAEPTPEELTLAQRAAAQRMRVDPTARRGYRDIDSIMQQTGEANADVTKQMREAQRSMHARLNELQSKMSAEERAHRGEGGLAAAGAKPAMKAMSAAERFAAADMGMLDFNLQQEYEDDELAAEDALFEEEEREYARMLQKEQQRKQHSTEQDKKWYRAGAASVHAEQLEEMNTEGWMLRHTREQSLDEIQKLYLGNKSLYALPHVLTQLTHLKSLDLNANHLRTLDCGEQHQQSLDADAHADAPLMPLTKLKELRELKVQHNELLHIHSFQMHPNLQTLRLDYNRIKDIGSNLRDNAKLSMLSINHNQLSSLPLGSLCSTSLTSLDVSNNNLTSLSFLPALTHLTELFASHNRFTGSIPNLSKLTALDELHLDHNEIESMEAMGSLPKLTVLNLAHNRIKKITGSVVVVPQTNNNASAAAAASNTTSPAKKEKEKPQRRGGAPVSAAAKDAKESAAIDAATIAAASAPSSAPSNAALAAAAAKSFPLFPHLTDLLISHNRINDVRAEFGTIYPNVETLDLSHNAISIDAQTLIARIKPVSETLVDLKLVGNPCTPSQATPSIAPKPPSRPSTALASARGAAPPPPSLPPSVVAYREQFIDALPMLEQLDEMEIPGRALDAMTGVAAAPSRPASALGNGTPRLTSRPSTAGPSRPGTASRSRPPLMRPPSASVRGLAAPPRLDDPYGLGSDDLLASSDTALNFLSNKMESNVAETTQELDAFKKRFEELMEKSVEIIKKRGLNTNLTARKRVEEEQQRRQKKVDDDDDEERVDLPPESEPTTTRNRTTRPMSARATPRFTAAQMELAQQVASSASASTTSSSEAPHSPIAASRPSSASSFAFATPSKQARPVTSDGRPLTASRRPGSAGRMSSSTPRQRLEDAKRFSTVYSNEEETSNMVDEITGERLPTPLTKHRASSAPYKQQHAKPSFVHPSQPLPPLSATPADDVPATASSTTSSKPSTPSRSSTATATKTKRPTSSRPPSATVSKSKSAPFVLDEKPTIGSLAKASGLFQSPFEPTKPVSGPQQSRAAKAAAEAKAVIEATKAAAETKRLQAAGHAASKPLPATRANPIHPTAAASGVRVSQPSISVNKPSVPIAAASTLDMHPMVKPAPRNVRQQVVHAQRAAAAKQQPEELPLDALEGRAEEDDMNGGPSGADEYDDENGDIDEDDPASTLFARPWSAHERAVRSAQNRLRSRPDSAARIHSGLMSSDGYGEDMRTYASFRVPDTPADPNVARQLHDQIHVNAYAHAGGSTAAGQQASAQPVPGLQLRGGGANPSSQLGVGTPRGSLPVAPNPFLLKSSIFSAQK